MEKKNKFCEAGVLWSLEAVRCGFGRDHGDVDAIRRNQKVMHGSRRVVQVRASAERRHDREREHEG